MIICIHQFCIDLAGESQGRGSVYMPRQRKDKQNLAEANEFWCFVARFVLFAMVLDAFSASWQFRTASYEFMSYKNICQDGRPPFCYPTLFSLCGKDKQK